MKEILCGFFISCISIAGMAQELGEFKKALSTDGKDPIIFVNEILGKHDLVIFDDALHHAYEPFVYYAELLRNKGIQKKVDYVFIEVFSIASQPFIDSYFSNPLKDSSLLLKVFQDDFSGYGWRYQTYLDLLSAIWDINKTLNVEEKIKVIGVDQPIYWDAIHNRKDYEIFQQSLIARDYFMYKIITQVLKDFGTGQKGIFLTNTRHAYKGVRNRQGNLYWNAATFFNQNHPGKSYSIRIHNVALFIESVKSTGAVSTEGLDRVSYKWVRMEGGKWDKAFAAMGNKPVAVPLAGNAFGRSGYVGNHMLDVQTGQTMQDAYDAIVFLAPIEELHFSARLNFIFTTEFKKELARRIMITSNNDTSSLFKKNEVANMQEYIEKLGRYEAMSKNNYLN